MKKSISLTLLSFVTLLTGGIPALHAATYQEEVTADGPVRYWRFEETAPDPVTDLAGAISQVLGTGNAASGLAAYRSLDGSLPALGVPGLLSVNPPGAAVSLLREAGQWALVPNHADINTAIRDKRTVEVWFKASSVPAPDTFGAEAIAGIWEEGGTGRSLNLYLWRDPVNSNPDEAELVFNVFNNANDGPGSPWGLPGTTPVWAHHTIRKGETYHVAAVLDGDRSGLTGSLILYVNGVAVAKTPGAGTLYSHGSDVRIGQGNSWYHEGTTGDVGSFDGVLDELAVYNTALPLDRVQSHYFTGKGSSGAGSVTIGAASDLAAKTVNEGVAAAFTVVAEGNGPFSYQWFRNGALLEGKTSATLSFAGAVAEAGSYTVKVSNQTNNITSTPAVLTVVPDLTPPSVLASKALAGGIDQVILDFNEPLDPVSAAALSTYSIAGLTVNSAVVSADGKRVTLFTSTQISGTVYTVTFSGLKDRAASGNQPAATLPVTSSAKYPEIIQADGPVRYWRFEESGPDEITGLASSTSQPAGSGDAASLVAAWNSLDGTPPGFAVPGLLATTPPGAAISLARAAGQWALVPIHADINNGIFAKRSVEVWFKANSVPAPDTVGGEAIAGIWEEGGTGRSINVYLWRDPANPNPDEAELVVNAFNNAADGPGSPWGLPGTTPVWAHYTVKTGRIYHVAAVLDGDRSGFGGSLILYVNGAAVARAEGVGTIYAHTSDIRIGQGNSWYHDGTTGDVGSFDGVLDELAVYNTALSASRARAHYFLGSDPAAVDTDGDGLPNDYETANGLNPNDAADAALDADSDGLSNLQEFLRGTKLRVADTDGDGLPDGVETGTGIWVNASDRGTSPFKTDSDGDGFADAVENPDALSTGRTQTASDPNKKDTDGDGWDDTTEIYFHSDARLATSVPHLEGGLNLLAYWPFDDASSPSVAQETVHGLNGSLTGKAVYTDASGGRSGAAGDRAVDFGLETPASVKVITGNFLNLAAENNQIAVSFWQKLHTVINSRPFLGEFIPASGDTRGISAHATWGDGAFFWDTAGCCDTKLSRLTIANPGVELIETWHHFVFQKAGDIKQIWLDGELLTEGINTAALPKSFTNLHIGSSANGAENTRGVIDDFAIFGSALDEATIKRLAAGATPPEVSSQIPPAATFSITGLNFTNGILTLAWESEAGVTYSVQRSRLLTPASSWETIATVPATSASTSWTDTVAPLPSATSSYFYRIVKP